jgi:hypothetical protein
MPPDQLLAEWASRQLLVSIRATISLLRESMIL